MIADPLYQAGADVKENLKNWAKAQEAELAEELGVATLSGTLDVFFLKLAEWVSNLWGSTLFVAGMRNIWP